MSAEPFEGMWTRRARVGPGEQLSDRLPHTKVSRPMSTSNQQSIVLVALRKECPYNANAVAVHSARFGLHQFRFFPVGGRLAQMDVDHLLQLGHK